MAIAGLQANTNHRFFVMTPQLVWALSRDPYDFILWNVVKMVAWDRGECILSTRDLATLSMMSLGKVQDCRNYLLRVGLLEGEFRRDPGYPQPVYHLRVPDLWQRNQQLIECSLGHSLKKRLAFKAAQRRQPALLPPAGLEAAPGEQGIPPGEQGLLPGEQAVLPGETNKITPDKPDRQEGQKRAEAGPPAPLQGRTVSLSPCEGPVVFPPDPNTFQISPLPLQRGGMRGGEIPANSQPWGLANPRFRPPPTSSHREEAVSGGSKTIAPAYLKSIAPDPPPGGTVSSSPPCGGPPDLHSSLLRLCRYQPDVVSSYSRKQVKEAVQRLQAHWVGPDELAEFESWWYGHDWRGKRGEPPEPRAVLDTWGRFKYQPQQEADYGRGYRFARPEEFGLA